MMESFYTFLSLIEVIYHHICCKRPCRRHYDLPLVHNNDGWFITDGVVVAVVDVLHITHAAVATVSHIGIFLGPSFVNWLTS